MHIICLTPLEPGIYNDHASDGIALPPDGWAYIPEDFPLPSTFPRLGGIKTKLLPYTYEGETFENVLTVVGMTEGTFPEPTPDEEPEPTAEELLNALLGVSE